MNKTILGLDLGTNSIGWALVKTSFDDKTGRIDGMGSRIIPMSQEVLGKFDSGITESQTAARTGFRGVRRLVQRDLLRRERLHRVLNVLGFLPAHYANEIDFEEHFGQFKTETEPKLVYKKDEKGKHEFIFMDSFYEMVSEFKVANPTLFYIKKNGKETKVPLDWTIYYLRKKALTNKIAKEELAWLLINFNQKRGYYQLRGEDEEIKENKLEEYYSLLVADVVDSGDRKGTDIWYNVILENGWIYRRSSRIPLFDWKGKMKEFIVTSELNEDGTVKKDKEGKERRSFRAPKEDDWTLVKKKTETDILNSKETVGCYIYDTLLKNPKQKINGKLVRTIERRFYKEELKAILETQIKHHPELQLEATNLYMSCIEELYPHNDAHKNNIKQRGFNYLFVDDIIFYQRPLKSKISLISNCSFETRRFLKDGKPQIEALKCIAKSHPLFQEFRLLQFVKNLKILKRSAREDIDVTSEYLQSEEDWMALFNWLNDKSEITQKQLLAYPKFKLKEDTFRWNFVEDKPYPCNETRSVFINKISKIEGIDASFFTVQNTEDLWHILYSVTDKIEIVKAIASFAKKHGLTEKLLEDFVTIFSKLKPYDKEYGSFSAKAIKKLLPLMRMDKNWNEAAIDYKTKDRIDKMINGEYDENILKRVRDKAINLTDINHFKGLPLWLASYIVYDRHSEASDIAKWESPTDIDAFLKEFKQHSLRNPIVEQVIIETLRVVRDIWIRFGNSKENFFNEIHLELGREMKNPADKRKQMTETISQNENTNMRIKALLSELKDDGLNEVRPYSPSQQELLKIYEEGVYQAEIRKDKLDEVDKIRKSNKPTKSEINKYKLWLEQGYISPYTGKMIPLSQLFTRKYDIEHIFPQSRYFDDSLTNKIICETEVNSLKDNQTAFQFIKKHHGQVITLNGGGSVKIFEVSEYENHVQRYFLKNKNKLKNLLSEEIPEGFIARQLNDSRYISKVVKSLLSKVVREEKDGELEQEATSKNIVPVTGVITSRMKQDWGLNDVWNEIITLRFERLNGMTSSNDFGQWENKQGKRVFQTTVPEVVAKGFSKKRIDHRHHAMDALVIACITKEHINYLNSINSARTNYSLISKLRQQVEETRTRKDLNGNNYQEKITVAKDFLKPWETFTQDVRDKLFETIVSFKQSNRVINKTNNKYQKWMPDIEGKMKKEIVEQTKGDNWAIRKPLHKETVYGKVILKRERQTPLTLNNALEEIDFIIDKNIKAIVKQKAVLCNGNITALKKYFKDNPIKIEDKKVDKVFVYEEITGTASRVTLDASFDKAKIASITDTAIQKILLSHLGKEKYQNQKDENGKTIAAHELAFSDDGLDEMNNNLTNHKPIFKVRTYEEGNKFPVGQTGNKKDKFVEGAKGTNLFFAIYQNDKGKRFYETIPLNEVIESQKQGFASAPEIDKNGNTLLFTLSPNDFVYVPTIEEQEDSSLVNFSCLTKEQVKRVYKMVSASTYHSFFIRNEIATSIMNKFEFSPLNKMEKTIDGIMIKDCCIKINIDRLGNITRF